MPTWPATLTFFRTTQGSGRRVRGGLLRSEMDVGPEKVRRRTSTAPQGRPGRMAFMTPAQLSIFEDFFEITLGDGALSFDALDPLDNTNRVFRFVDGYDVTKAGDLFTVTAELEILP